MKPLYVVPGGKRMHLYPECIPARSQHRVREATKAEAMALKLCPLPCAADEEPMSLREGVVAGSEWTRGASPAAFGGTESTPWPAPSRRFI